MELTQFGFLEELLAPARRDTWGSFSSGLNEYFPSGWSFDSLDDNPSLAGADASNISSSFVGFSAPTEPSFECPPFSTDHQHQTYHHPFAVDGFTVPEIESSSYTNNIDMPSFPSMEMEDHDQLGLLSNDDDLHHESLEDRKSCSVEIEQATSNNIIQCFNLGLCGDKKRKNKKVEGQPSKNLMAERRRRKRLNDRLSMLRSIVPKISKMDRTSILGDTIDYMKELLERINKLQEDETELGTNQLLMGNFTERKSNEALVRNSPKFDVERREIDTRIDICCASKPGLLLSTVGTLEALGLEIQQCVISCFNDFSFQASCSEASEQRTLLNSEEVKQALFRNAGYGGRCL